MSWQVNQTKESKKSERYRLFRGQNRDFAVGVQARPTWRLIQVVILLVVIGTVLTGCTTTTGSDSSSNNSGVTDGNVIPPAFTPTVRKSKSTTPLVSATITTNIGGKGGSSKAKAGPASLYPDPNLTPGDVFPSVTKQEVCVSGYSSSVRSVSQAEKNAVYAEYGIANVTGQHEVDHFISLELGGSNDIKNLWPEPYAPKPGAHEKDTVENALHAAVCNGTMSLAQAQSTISQDWYAYYLQIKP